MADAAKQEPVITMWSKEFTYDRWMKSKGIPIHRGYFIEDLRTIELEWWEERGCKAAFIQLLGQEGVSASRAYHRVGRRRQAQEELRMARALDVFSAAQSLACVQQYAGRQADPTVSLQLHANGDVGVAGTGHVFQ